MIEYSAALPPACVRSAVEASFREQEHLVWEQLSGLVRDAAWLKSYMVASLLVFKEAMQVGKSSVDAGGCRR
jgi:hypothetical protein